MAGGARGPVAPRAGRARGARTGGRRLARRRAEIPASEATAGGAYGRGRPGAPECPTRSEQRHRLIRGRVNGGGDPGGGGTRRLAALARNYGGEPRRVSPCVSVVDRA